MTLASTKGTRIGSAPSKLPGVCGLLEDDGGLCPGQVVPDLAKSRKPARRGRQLFPMRRRALTTSGATPILATTRHLFCIQRRYEELFRTAR